MRRFPEGALWMIFISLFAIVFIPPVFRRVPHADDFPQLTQKCKAMHLHYEIWCYSNGECYGIAWPDKYDFIGHNKVSSWVKLANTKQAVAESLALALESAPNTPPTDIEEVYDSGTRP